MNETAASPGGSTVSVSGAGASVGATVQTPEPKYPPLNPGFGVVLGGGGVLCAAELGVLRALAEWGVRPSVVVGASGGGIIAGALGAGVSLDALTATLRIVCAHPDRYGLGILRAVEDVFREDATPGLWSLQHALEDVLLHGTAKWVGQWMWGYAVVATDVDTGKPLYLYSDNPRWPAAMTPTTPPNVSSLEALQATSAFPGLFQGVRDWGGRLFQDGGLIDNVAGNLAAVLGADYLLTVVLGGSATVPSTLSPLGALYYGVTASIRAAQRPEPKVPTVTLRPTLPAGAWLLSYELFPALLQAGYAAAVAHRGEIEKLAAEA